MINIFVDDAALGASSKKYVWYKEVDWFRIRHYFEEDVGKKECTLNLFFAIQRYMNLLNYIRNAPVIFFKASVNHEFSDRKLVGQVTGGALSEVDRMCREVLIKKNVDEMSTTIVKMIGYKPFKIRI